MGNSGGSKDSRETAMRRVESKRKSVMKDTIQMSLSLLPLARGFT